jgi:hypothetical protein
VPAPGAERSHEASKAQAVQQQDAQEAAYVRGEDAQEAACARASMRSDEAGDATGEADAGVAAGGSLTFNRVQRRGCVTIPKQASEMSSYGFPICAKFHTARRRSTR